MFFTLFSESYGEQVFMNGVCEKRSSFGRVQMQDIADSQYVELTQMRGFQLRFIKHILTGLGLKHSQDTETVVARTLVEGLTDWVMENHKEIHTVFGFRDRAKSGTITFKVILDVINKCLNQWIGSTITPATKDRNKKTLTYRLVPSTVFMNIVREPIETPALGNAEVWN